MKWIFALVFMIGVGMVGVLFFMNEEKESPVHPYAYNDGVLHINDARFSITVLKENDERMRGLSGQESIGGREALLFVFPQKGMHSIWMKDMLFSIDIIWLDDALRVVSIKERATPDSFRSAADAETFRPTAPARYVLEVRAGAVRDAGISLGDTAVFLP